MVNQQLVDYIKGQIKAGYNITALRNYLIKYGYNAKDVDDALNLIYHPEIKHVIHHISNKTIIAIAAIAIMIVILIPTIYFLMSQTSETARLLDLRTSAITSNVRPGTNLEFNIELSNLGKTKRYDVNLKHEILGTDIAKEETIAVETSTSKKSFIEIPEDITPKRYTLKTTASYGDKKALSTMGFAVISGSNQIITTICIENWNCEAWTPSICPSAGKQTRICSDSNNCLTTKDKPDITQTCTYSAQQPAQVTLLETSGLTIWQKLDQIKETAKINPTKAEGDCAALEVESHRDECYNNIAQIILSENLCEKIIGERTKDKCYSDMAKATAANILCEKISTSTRKDTCYMNFVNNKDYTVCEKIENSYLREACTTLRDMPNLIVS